MVKKNTSVWRSFWFDPKGRAKLEGLKLSTVFWGVLCAKLIASCFFASDYLLNLFIPFVESFATNPLQNPYAAFLAQGKGDAFPYPAIMLYLLAAPRWLVGFVTQSVPSGFVLLFLYRLPLLLADLVIVSVLARWARQHTNKVLWFYWASPVLFYITYLHGQLDVIPIALLFLSLYGLFKEKFVFSALAMGLGLAAKTHVVIALPFFLIYLWRQTQSVKTLLIFIGTLLAAFIVPNLPFAFDPALYAMVLHNAAQRKLTLATLATAPDAGYYVILGAYILLLFRAIRITAQNRDLFLMFLGFSFGALLLFLAPMPGWYFWVIPFFAYFFSRSSGSQSLLLWALQGAYLIYFFVRADSDFFAIFQLLSTALATLPTPHAWLEAHGGNGTVAVNIAYTLLQTLLGLNCAWIYRRGVRGLQKHKLSSSSFLIGISGDSGSGKTTLAESLTDLFTPRNVLVICGDDMHKWQRGHTKWQELTHLDPRANLLHQELNYITALRHHRSVKRRHYDHDTGQFTPEIEMRPRPIVLFEGLHSFYLKPARDMMDLKVFVKPDDALLLHRKILRDMNKRGYSKEKVMAAIEKRKADSEKFIHTQEQNADIVVAFRLEKPFKKVGEKDQNPPTWLEVTAPNAFYFDPLLADLGDVLGKDLCHSYDEEDRQTLGFHRPVPQSVIEALGEKHLSGLDDLGVYSPEWKAGYSGILQLLLAWCIFADSRRSNQL